MALLRVVGSASGAGEWYVPPAGVTIGRDAANADLVVRGVTISRQHCRVLQGNDGGWRLHDLDSTNGVYLDGARVEGCATIGAAQVIGLGQGRKPDLVFYPPNAFGRTRCVTLPAAESWTIGRGLDADLALPEDAAVSLRHAELRIGPHGLQIHDIGSRNGVWVDGRRVNRARVYFDAVVRVGHSRLRFEALPDGRLGVYILAPGEGICVQALRISCRTRDESVLGDVAIVVEQGAVIGILGAEGSGNHLLLEILAGHRTPERGVVLYNDVPLHGQMELFRSKAGWVDGDPALHSE
ncbi:MAG: FHA domain-containing protein, partial [Wenzhouxiangellaceae bacterium]